MLIPRLHESNQGDMQGYCGITVKLGKMPDALIVTERYGFLDAMGYAAQTTASYTVLNSQNAR